MSHQVVRWVMEHSRLKLPNRGVLFVLAEHADATGRGSRPSIATVAKEAGCCERRVYKAIADAIALRELEKLSRAGPKGTNVYRFPQVDAQLTLLSVDPAVAASCRSGILSDQTKNPAARADEPPRTVLTTTSTAPLAFQGSVLKITCEQDAKLRAAYPTLKVGETYLEMDAYLDSHRNEGKGQRKNHYAFARNWLAREKRDRIGGADGTRSGTRKASGAVAAVPGKYDGCEPDLTVQ